MQKDVSTYSKDSLNIVKEADFLTEEDFSEVALLSDELQDTFQKQQIWRTETEMRISVLNDVKHPTKASKYWQSVREQAVFFNNLVTLSFDYRRNEVELKRKKRKLSETKDDLEVEEIEIDIEECLYKRKSMQLQAKDRMREIKLWSKIKKELDDGSFDIKDPDSHQLCSYTKQFLRQGIGLAMSPNASSGDVNNLLGKLKTALKSCEEKGVLKEVVGSLTDREQTFIAEKFPVVFSNALSIK